jgi:hypothetical protein
MKLESRVLEIRDEGTCIAAIAISMQANTSEASLTSDQIKALIWLIHDRSGYPNDGSGIILMRLADQEAHVDPYDRPNRTMRTAHQRICEMGLDHFLDGEVIDVRVLLGEATEPVRSDRLYEAKP